jgi:hypothetical protein
VSVCKNEGSFGCEAVASALGQPNVPECVGGFRFLFRLYVAKISLSFCRLFWLFTMNANVPGRGGAVSGGGTPMSKSKKKFVSPRDMAAKPLLVCRWPPWRPWALVGQLLSWGVLSSLEE